MKHIFYVLLAALAIFLAACRKDKKPDPVYLDGNWRQIGEIGFGTIWYPAQSINVCNLKTNGIPSLQIIFPLQTALSNC